MGETVSDRDAAFPHWSRLWDIYNNSQLLTTFKELMRRCGLKVRSTLRVAAGQCRIHERRPCVASRGAADCPLAGCSESSFCRCSLLDGLRPLNRTASWMLCGRCTV